MANTALFTSPMARKKKVECKYNPNTYRVISQQAEDIPPPKVVSTFTSTADFNIVGQPAEARPTSEHRHNRPNPVHVGFLRQDVALLNEPVCDVYTTETRKEQRDWWPSRVSNEPLKKPPYSIDTTVRSDYQWRGEGKKRNTRHASNPNKMPSHGTVPVNFLREPDGKQRWYKEGISYEHQYNSRLDPSYPIRGKSKSKQVLSHILNICKEKRHGGFVWDQIPPGKVNEMLHHYGYVSDKKEQTDRVPATDSPKPAVAPCANLSKPADKSPEAPNQSQTVVQPRNSSGSANRTVAHSAGSHTADTGLAPVE